MSEERETHNHTILGIVIEHHYGKEMSLYSREIAASEMLFKRMRFADLVDVKVSSTLLRGFS
jgi:hypothetical protein